MPIYVYMYIYIYILYIMYIYIYIVIRQISVRLLLHKLALALNNIISDSQAIVALKRVLQKEGHVNEYVTRAGRTKVIYKSYCIYIFTI